MARESAILTGAADVPHATRARRLVGRSRPQRRRRLAGARIGFRAGPDRAFHLDPRRRLGVRRSPRAPPASRRPAAPTPPARQRASAARRMAAARRRLRRAARAAPPGLALLASRGPSADDVGRAAPGRAVPASAAKCGRWRSARACAPRSTHVRRADALALNLRTSPACCTGSTAAWIAARPAARRGRAPHATTSCCSPARPAVLYADTCSRWRAPCARRCSHRRSPCRWRGGAAASRIGQPRRARDRQPMGAPPRRSCCWSQPPWCCRSPPRCAAAGGGAGARALLRKKPRCRRSR